MLNSYDTLCKHVGVESLTHINNSHFKIYPNPAREQVTFEYSEGEITRLAVYDVKGVLVYNTDLTGTTHSLELSKWTKGIYLCKFTQSHGNIQTQKLVVE